VKDETHSHGDNKEGLFSSVDSFESVEEKKDFFIHLIDSMRLDN
jgi:hypothetical protein